MYKVKHTADHKIIMEASLTKVSSLCHVRVSYQYHILQNNISNITQIS